MSPRRQVRRSATVVGALAVGASALSALAIISWPCAYQGQSVTYRSDGAMTVTDACDSFLEVNGTSSLAVLAVPVTLAALVLGAVRWARRSGAWAAATVLLLFSLAAGFSIGLFFLPASVLSLVAAGLARPVWEPAKGRSG